MAKAWAATIADFRDRDVEAAVQSAASQIANAARQFRMDENYLNIQVRIHMPRYTRDRLKNDSTNVVQEVLATIAASYSAHADLYDDFRVRNRVESLPPDGYVVRGAIPEVRSRSGKPSSHYLRMGTVPPDLGKSIQEDFHYIHVSRTDTLDHFGMYAEDATYPLCYAAVSLCDRGYQRRAISAIIPNVSSDNILVMTRAFSFRPMPKNAMSIFYDQISQYYSAQREFLCVITAMNPLLGFRGSSFLGSSYVPFASSPMTYQYDETGRYQNRRASDAASFQGLSTPPILWLGRGLTRAVQRRLESNEALYSVTPEEYAAG